MYYINYLRKFIVTKQFTATNFIKRIVKSLRDTRNSVTQDTQGNKDRRPKTIVLKLLNYKDKVKVFRNVNKLKESGIYINEDFCKETTDRRKELWKEVKVLRDQGKYAVIRYDRIVQHDFKR